MDSSMIELRDAVLRLEGESLKADGSLGDLGENSTMLKAMSNAINIEMILKPANRNLSQSWKEIATLCDGVSNNVYFALKDVAASINAFVNQSIENESIYKPALDKTTSEVERLYKELDLHESLG